MTLIQPGALLPLIPVSTDSPAEQAAALRDGLLDGPVGVGGDDGQESVSRLDQGHDEAFFRRGGSRGARCAVRSPREAGGYSDPWKVRPSTSSCCARVSRTKLTA